MKDLGYNKPLFILAFDHRASFVKKMFGISGKPTAEQVKKIAESKKIIFEGFKKAVVLGIPKASAAVLVDEQFGDAVLRGAKKENFLTCLATEKSGLPEFEFEYGEIFGKHIEKYRPNFVKALVRYNPDGDHLLNTRQRTKLKFLSDFCHENGYKFIIEPLIPPTGEQLAEVDDDELKYDLEVRPELTVSMIEQLQEGGVEADVWKIEGLETPSEYEAVVKQSRENGREDSAVVVLGRAAPISQVEDWLNAGRGVSGVLGFAIGRTIWQEPLENWKAGKFSAEKAANTIAENYFYFYKVFTSK